MSSFAEALCASPIGAALLAHLELQQRSPRRWVIDDPSCDPAHVEQAAASVAAMSFGSLLAAVVEASGEVGPWNGGGADNAWASYLHAGERGPIASAIAARFGDELHAPIALNDQQWWLHAHGAPAIAPLFHNLDNDYENGEVPSQALQAHGPAPDEVLPWIAEYGPIPISRWAVPVDKRARVFEINRPEDWHELCVRYPRQATSVHGSWGLPGPHSVPRSHPLFTLENQHAASRTPGTHLCPQWSRVANDFDAVHLSWAGFITTEGFVYSYAGKTTTLRYWHSELTMWINDCFGKPTRLPKPDVVVPAEFGEGTEVFADLDRDSARLAQDRRVIAEMFRR